MARRRRGRSKAKSQRAHARRRLGQRTELSGDGVLDAAVAAIRAGKSRPVLRQSHRITVHDVDIGDTTIRVVYDRKRASIATVLTTDMDPSERIWIN